MKKVIIYRVLATRTCNTIDMDMCPTWEEETFYDELFAEKEDAIAAAQKKCDKQKLNTYVSDVYAAVFRVTISKGKKQEKIYHKYRENKNT